MIGGPSTKMPRSLSSFLHNSVNKQQLIQFLLTEWSKSSYGKRLHGQSVFFVCEEKCTQIQSVDGLSVSATEVDELRSTHEEADTRIILHCMYAMKHQNLDNEHSIVVKSPDTDIFILLLAYQHLMDDLGNDLLFETGTGDKHRFLIQFLLTEWSKSSYGKRLHGQSVFFVCEEKCTQKCTYEDMPPYLEMSPKLCMVFMPLQAVIQQAHLCTRAKNGRCQS